MLLKIPTMSKALIKQMHLFTFSWSMNTRHADPLRLHMKIVQNGSHKLQEVDIRLC